MDVPPFPQGRWDAAAVRRMPLPTFIYSIYTPPPAETLQPAPVGWVFSTPCGFVASDRYLRRQSWRPYPPFPGRVAFSLTEYLNGPSGSPGYHAVDRS